MNATKAKFNIYDFKRALNTYWFKSKNQMQGYKIQHLVNSNSNQCKCVKKQLIFKFCSSSRKKRSPFETVQWF